MAVESPGNKSVTSAARVTLFDADRDNNGRPVAVYEITTDQDLLIGVVGLHANADTPAFLLPAGKTKQFALDATVEGSSAAGIRLVYAQAVSTTASVDSGAVAARWFPDRG